VSVSALALPGVQGFLDESADHVGPDTPFSGGDDVDCGDDVGVEADSSQVFGHTCNHNTGVDNVTQRVTVLGMTNIEITAQTICSDVRCDERFPHTHEEDGSECEMFGHVSVQRVTLTGYTEQCVHCGIECDYPSDEYSLDSDD
jgi:hypothetical protein